MAQFIRFLTKKKQLLALLIFAGGLIFYSIQSFKYANTIPSTVWDEGMYMYNGYLFTTGEYIPYQDGSPWTNQLPFAYLMSGIPQILFGPGMRTGRYFAVLMGVLSLLGLSLAAKRLGGDWWAAAVAWIVALNSGWVMAFSQVFSQGMVSFMVAWALFFLVGKKQPTRDLIASAFLFGLAGMVRVNVLPLVFLMILYVFWQKKAKDAVVVLLAGLIPIIFFHALYWPNILKFWAYWIPPNLFPMITDYISPWRELFLPSGFSWLPISSWWGDPTHLAWRGVGIFVDSFRSNVISWLGIIVAIIFSPWKKGGEFNREMKLQVFLIGTYIVMFVIHSWAAMGGKTCTFSCLPGYFLFFNWFGIMALIVSSRYWNIELKMSPYLIVIILVLFSYIGFEYQMGSSFRDERTFIISEILGVDVDSIKTGSMDSDLSDHTVFNFLIGKGVNVVRWLRFIWKNELLTRLLWWTIPIAMVAFPLFVIRLIPPTRVFHFRSLHILLLVALSAIFASRPLFSQPLTVSTCDGNVIDQMELIGAQIQSVIEPGTSVFWDVKSTIPLLYILEAEIHPPQIGARFTLVTHPVSEFSMLNRFGWWSTNLAEEWIKEDDYAVVEYRFYDDFWSWEDRVSDGGFNIIQETGPSLLCTGKSSALVVLKRNP